MFVLIAGGGRTGSELAHMLLELNHQVRLLEHRPDVLSFIHRELPTEAVYEGDATDPVVLEQAGVRQAQVLAACLPNDADNLALCFVARSLYGVPRTIAQINNPRNAWLFDAKFHVDVALNQSEILAKLIEEEMSLGDMMPLLKLRRGQYTIVEEKVPEGARAIGVAIKDLGLPDECVIATIIRQGRILVPYGATVIEARDEVLAITDRQGADILAALLAPPQPPDRSREGAGPGGGLPDGEAKGAAGGEAVPPGRRQRKSGSRGG